MNALDIIVIVVIALSALFAFARGFVKEALSIGAWAGAAAVTLYGLPYAEPFARRVGNRDEHGIRLRPRENPFDLTGPAQHGHALQASTRQTRIVVYETDHLLACRLP